MATSNLHQIPKISDRLSYLYIEHAKIDKEAQAIAIHNAFGTTPVPCAGLSLLMLGPGVSITHAAIMVLAGCGCLVAWVGEFGVRFYASGTGITRSAANIMKQASYWADDGLHLNVVRAMYEMRFPDKLDSGLTLQQIRGHEGVRVRDTYARLSKQYEVVMVKRDYDRSKWTRQDPINKALSVANSCLYGVCHAAIVAAGYSPALGFVHTGKQLSFVYDIADLYKMETSVVAAFKTVASGIGEIERRTRMVCRDEFYSIGLLKRIVRDIHSLFDIDCAHNSIYDDYAGDQAQPGGLWEPGGKVVEGGLLYGIDDDKQGDS
ncbi:MAG: type I-E CRISPR-associated endonuclease Cas1e [Eubacteriales bacterium]|jgi:CRISPR-associated protein Cas1|nr:type I-E CRISPR-associated endonuclease Cas1e [Eubacteriales bacterium]MDD4686524.1 type I-E CRISPR-associated endonuclease Cas1e [Candidatus Cloacimonadota bacterium]